MQTIENFNLLQQNQPSSSVEGIQRSRQAEAHTRSPITLQPLPEPDWMDFQLPPEHICLITNDGTALTEKLAQSLIESGLPVVTVSFLDLLNPQSSIPPTIPHVAIENSDEAHLQQQLSAIASEYGAIGAVIYLHPLLANREAEHLMIQQAFVLAKHLKLPLDRASQKGSSCFMTVTHLDGALGTAQANYSPIAGGLFGLTKALRWEWESVFCRAIDFSPDLEVAASVGCILAELHDPNRLVAEVGYSSQGRATLVV